MNHINLLFRKKQIGRKSIEGLFAPIEKLEGIRRIELPCDLNSIRNVIKLFLFALKTKGRNVHITGDVYYMAFFFIHKNVLLTIHDSNHYEDLKGLRRFMVGLIWFRIPMLVSKKIIVISPFVKDQLTANFNIRKEKILIIPNSFKTITKLSVSQPNDFFKILAIGTKENKNLQRLFESVKGAENLQLIIVGILSNETISYLKNHKINYNNEVNVTDFRLTELYNSSDVLYFASTKEGFGLPILEAQSCGLPVITSKTTSMPYVAGKGALIVDPYSISEIKQAILTLQNNKGIQEELIEYGYLNINRFSQEKFVSAYLKIYKNLK